MQFPRKRRSVYESGRCLTQRRKGRKAGRNEDGFSIKKSSPLCMSLKNLCVFASLREPKLENAIPSQAWISLRIRKVSHAKTQRRKGRKAGKNEDGFSIKKSSPLCMSLKNLGLQAFVWGR
jgi:hypothetical protein